jgi:hypothetical protein
MPLVPAISPALFLRPHAIGLPLAIGIDKLNWDKLIFLYRVGRYNC